MDENIVYQSNDVLFKVLSENYKNIALNIYGFNFPQIKSMIPNTFPVIKADEKRSDNIFLLEDGSILLLEYESNTRIEENMIKYVDYILRIITRYFKEENVIKKIRLAVIYSSDIDTAPEEFDMEGLTIKSHNVYMKNYNGDEIEDKIRIKIRNGITLIDEDVMQFILLPFMKRNRKRDKIIIIKDSIELAKEVKDEKQQMTIIAGLLTASNKYIDEEYAKEVRRWMKMTAVDKVYEKEKQEAIEKERLEKEKERLEKEKERLEKQQAIIGLQNMVMSTIKNRYNSTSVTLVKSIGKITDISVLQLINDEIFKAEDIKTLEKFVKEIIE